MLHIPIWRFQSTPFGTLAYFDDFPLNKTSGVLNVAIRPHFVSKCMSLSRPHIHQHVRVDINPRSQDIASPFTLQRLHSFPRERFKLIVLFAVTLSERWAGEGPRSVDLNENLIADLKEGKNLKVKIIVETG